MRRIYFGHPKNTYGTELERFLLRKMRALNPDVEVVNPADEAHQAAVRALAAAGGNPFEYFTATLVPSCDGGVFLPFRDGRYGAGVHEEAMTLHRLGRPTWSYSPGGDAWLWDPEADVPLTVEETRERLRDAAGNPKPY